MTDKERFYETIAGLEAGTIRVAEKVDGEWKVNSWVKEVILSGFRLGRLEDMTQGQFLFADWYDYYFHKQCVEQRRLLLWIRRCRRERRDWYCCNNV